MLTRNLEWIEISDDKRRNLRMVKLAEELFLVHDRVDTALGDNAGLGHLLHGEQLLFFLEVDSPNFAETAPSDDVLEVEMVLVDFYKRNKIS